MGTTEITVEQFRRAGQPFDKQSDYLKQASDEAAMLSLKQQFAFAFCNAISEEHKLEPCYGWTTSQSGLILVPKANHVTLSGYRLPTECEWEIACRAGSQTHQAFGNADELVVSYGWHNENSQQQHRNNDGVRTSQPVGQLLPNRWGLFDMYGNARELCDLSIPPTPGSITVDDPCPQNPGSGILRGTCLIDHGITQARSSSRLELFERYEFQPDNRGISIDPLLGLRIVRTLHTSTHP